MNNSGSKITMRFLKKMLVSHLNENLFEMNVSPEHKINTKQFRQSVHAVDNRISKLLTPHFSVHLMELVKLVSKGYCSKHDFIEIALGQIERPYSFVFHKPWAMTVLTDWHNQSLPTSHCWILDSHSHGLGTPIDTINNISTSVSLFKLVNWFILTVNSRVNRFLVMIPIGWNVNLGEYLVFFACNNMIEAEWSILMSVCVTEQHCSWPLTLKTMQTPAFQSEWVGHLVCSLWNVHDSVSQLSCLFIIIF